MTHVTEISSSFPYLSFAPEAKDQLQVGAVVFRTLGLYSLVVFAVFFGL